MGKYSFLIRFLLLLLAFQIRNSIAQPGAPDPDFIPNQLADIQDFTSIKILEVLPDGKLLIFHNNGLAILNRQQKKIWSTSQVNQKGDFQVAKRLNDGRILASGYIYQPGIGYKGGVFRFLQDGSLDTSFQNAVSYETSYLYLSPAFSQLLVQNDGKILVLSSPIRLMGIDEPKSIFRLLPDGQLDNSFQTNRLDNGSSTEYSVKMGLLEDGKILIGNNRRLFNGTPVPSLIRLLSNGQLDTDFENLNWTDPILRMEPWKDGGFMVVASGSNSKISFTGLKSDGTIDLSFSSFTVTRFYVSGRRLENHPIFRVYPNGHLLVYGKRENEGTFLFHKYGLNGNWSGSMFSGQVVPELTYNQDFQIVDEDKILFVTGVNSIQKKARNGLALFNNQSQLLEEYCSLINGLYYLTCTKVGPDNKILAGGGFTQAYGKERFGIARLHPDGNLDSTFIPDLGENGRFVAKMAIQNDGKILVLWALPNTTPFGNSYLFSFQRLNPNGKVDSTFLHGGTPFGFTIRSFFLQPDGKIVLADFQNGNSRITRILNNGNPDPEYSNFIDPNWVLGDMVNFDPLPFGKIMVTSWQNGIEGPNFKTGIFRLFANGKVDSSFVDQASSTEISKIHGSVPMEDGKILLFGNFKRFAQKPRNGIVVLRPDGTVDEQIFDLSILSEFIGNQSFLSCLRAIRQNDGKWIFLLDFSSSVLIVKYNADGTFDPAFVPFVPKSNLPYIPSFTDVMVFQFNQEKLIAGFYGYLSENQANNTLVRLLLGEQEVPGKIQVGGQVWRGENMDCQTQGKVGQQEQFLLAQPGSIYSSSKESGTYQFQLQPGISEITQIQSSFLPGGGQISQVCPAENKGQTLAVSQSSDSLRVPDFVNQLSDCPQLQIWVQSGPKKPCQLGQTVVQVSNYGNRSYDGDAIAYLKLPLGVSILSSEFPLQFSSLDSSYQFQIGSVPAFSRKLFLFKDSMDCIFKDLTSPAFSKSWFGQNSFCKKSGKDWNGADIRVSSRCLGSDIRYVIRNEGLDMSQPLNYQIFADTVLAWEQSFRLNGSDSLRLRLPKPKTGVTYRLEIPQPEGHPLVGFAFTESNCQPAKNPKSQFSIHNANPVSAIQTIKTDSLPPIFLEASPKGIGNMGLTLQYRPIDYTLHFQNRSPDTVRHAIVRIYRDEDLDLGSFQAGPSSHTFQISLAGKGKAYLDFTFKDVIPPQNSTSNASGFVSFRIWPQKNLQPGTRLIVQSDLFLDKKPSLRSEAILNTIWKPELRKGLIDTVIVEKIPEGDFVLYPNPSPGKSIIETRKAVDFQLFNVNGQILEAGHFEAGDHSFTLSHLPGGMYFLRIRSEGNSNVVKVIRE
jgi:uncharacterized delta-60 repeat protein